MKTSFHDSERRQKRDLLASLACMTARTYSGRRKDDRSSIILGSAIKDANYREKSAVERLPPRGTQLEGDRKMRETLSLVHEAITFDAHSPRVSTLNQHLEEIIRRI